MLISLTALSQNLLESSNCIVFLPSQLFGSQSYSNDLSLKDEALRANVFNAIEDSIVTDISALHFLYDPSLSMAWWIDASLLANINTQLNALPENFMILPEHFLLGFDRPKVFFSHDQFCISFADGSGFSGDRNSFEQFDASLGDANFDRSLLESLSIEENVVIPKSFEARNTIKSLSQFHIDFLNSPTVHELNFFQRQFSLGYLQAKMNITRRDVTLLLTATIVLLIAPLLSSYLFQSSANSYADKTVQIFQQLNPSFQKIVNARAQSDDLARNVPEETLEIMSLTEELQLLTYLNQLNDQAFTQIDIDLNQQSIAISVKNLSRLKFALIQEALSQYSVIIDDSGLKENNSLLFGSLVLRYQNG